MAERIVPQRKESTVALLPGPARSSFKQIVERPCAKPPDVLWKWAVLLDNEQLPEQWCDDATERFHLDTNSARHHCHHVRLLPMQPWCFLPSSTPEQNIPAHFTEASIPDRMQGAGEHPDVRTAVVLTPVTVPGFGRHESISATDLANFGSSARHNGAAAKISQDCGRCRRHIRS